jgi:phage portal protein BeeE
MPHKVAVPSLRQLRTGVATADIYGVSSELVNDPENKTQANKKESRRGLYMDVVIPQMQRVYAELNRWLVPRFNQATGKRYHIDFDVSAIEALSEDMERKANWLARSWWLTDDERRGAMDYEELQLPETSVTYQPAGMFPAGQIDDMLLREAELTYGRKTNGVK